MLSVKKEMYFLVKKRDVFIKDKIKKSIEKTSSFFIKGKHDKSS